MPNAIQNSAISLVEEALNTPQSIDKDDPNLQYMRMTSGNAMTAYGGSAGENKRVFGPATEALLAKRGGNEMAAASGIESKLLGLSSSPAKEGLMMAAGDKPGLLSGLDKEILSNLPKVITPEFKDNLRTLSEYAKAGDKATPEQEEAAIKAYKAVGVELKKVILQPVIKLGIIASLSKIPVIGSMAPMIADVAAEPLAEMAAKMDMGHGMIAMKLLNLGLKAIGRDPIEDRHIDTFAAKTLGSFSGTLLEQIELREKNGTLRGDMAKAQQETAIAKG